MSQCRKRRFVDRIGADLALAEITRKDRTKRETTEVRSYPCPRCHGFHLTHEEKRS